MDGAIASAWQSYAANASFLSAAVSQRKDELAALAGPGLEHFSEARRAYLKRVEEGVAAVRAAGLEGAARAAADALAARVEEARRVPTALLGSVEAAWAQFVGMPAVGRVLAASRGQVEAAAKTYQSAHSALVADPRYSAAVARGGALLQSLQASGAYQAAQARLAPFLAPATQLAAPYVQAVATHLAPVPASA